jgi:hypothetical protein
MEEWGHVIVLRQIPNQASITICQFIGLLRETYTRGVDHSQVIAEGVQQFYKSDTIGCSPSIHESILTGDALLR